MSMERHRVINEWLNRKIECDAFEKIPKKKKDRKPKNRPGKGIAGRRRKRDITNP